MSLHVFVPLRSPGHGKTRLAPHLSVVERAEVAGAMLADVVAAVRGAGLGRPTVLASGDAAAAAGAALGCPVRVDGDEAGLNEALRAATRTLDEDDDLLVLLGDLPLVSAADVAAVVAASGPVVLAPARDGGTAALLRRPATAMGTAFGPGSAAAHRSLAEAAGLTVTSVRRPGLATDLDTLADLEALPSERVGTALAEVLATMRDG